MLRRHAHARMPPVARHRSPAFAALLVAMVMNVLNLFEPLTVDDVAHHYYAAQVAKEPLRPFEFETVWHQKPVPAWDVMVAPVTSYYWAPILLVFPGSPVAWKAWFLPVQWLFCWSLLLLLCRWAPRVAVPLLVAIALGPAVLPGVNLMLEVPLLALAFASLTALLRAFDRRSIAWAAFAGLLLGLAFQTKYSALGFVAPWTLLALAQRRWRELAAGLAVAAATALAIEGLVSLSHGGGSYFMRQLELAHQRDWHHLTRGLLLQVSWLGVPAAVLALLGLGARHWAWCGAGALFVAGHVGVAMSGGADHSFADGSVDSIAYLAMAACTWGTLGCLLLCLARSVLRSVANGRVGRSTGLRMFLLGWIPAEICSSLLVSPFPAARRSLLVVLAFTVAAGWLVARRRGIVRHVRVIAACTALLGVAYQGIDLLEGKALVSATADAMAFARAADPRATVWFGGGWGFEFEAPRAGMRPLLRGEAQVAAGDFVAIGSVDGLETPWWRRDCPVWTARVDQQAHEFAPLDALPLSTLFGYYSGRRPLEGQRGPRYVVRVHRVREGFHARQLTVDDDNEHPAHRLR